VLEKVKRYSGTPTSLAQLASQELQFPVERSAISHVLRDNNLTLKKTSPVPGLSVASEREVFTRQLSEIWTRAEQAVFLDEKKFNNQATVNRKAGFGYAKAGERLPPRLQPLPHRGVLPAKLYAIGAVSVTTPAPMLSGEMGDVGLIALRTQNTKISAEDYAEWVINSLAPLMGCYPAPRSILMLDNSPEHRSYEKEIMAALNRKGAVLLWLPPKSPDLNVIEKLWDVALARTNRHAVELSVEGRALNEADLLADLMAARMTRDSLRFRQQVKF